MSKEPTESTKTMSEEPTDQEAQDAAALQRHLDAEDLPSIEERVAAIEKFIEEEMQ